MGISVTAKTCFNGYSGAALPGDNRAGVRTDLVNGQYVPTYYNCRFTLETDAYGASEVQIAGLRKLQSQGGRLRMDVGEDPDEHRKGGSGAGVALSTEGTGSLAVRLQPNSTYYLWLFYHGWSDLFSVGQAVVSATGSYGTAAELEAEDGFFDSALPITLTGGGAGASYTVTVTLAGITETLARGSTATDFVWTPALSVFAPLFPNSDGGEALLTAESFYAGVSIGTRSRTVRVRFAPGALPPVLREGWVTAAPQNEGAAAGFSCYIQGYSRARLRFDGSKISCPAGATPQRFTVLCAGVESSGSPCDTPVLPGTEAALLCTVTDSRGQQASETLTITLEPYARPRFGEIAVFRCDAQGTEDEGGNCLSVRAALHWSALAGENTVSLRALYRPRSGGEWSSVTLTPGVAAVIPAVSADRSYDLRLEATDGLGSGVEYEQAIPSRVWAMKFRPDGGGVAFGKAAEADAALELGNAWQLVLHDSQGQSAALDYASLRALLALIT